MEDVDGESDEARQKSVRQCALYLMCFIFAFTMLRVSSCLWEWYLFRKVEVCDQYFISDDPLSESQLCILLLLAPFSCNFTPSKSLFPVSTTNSGGS